MSHVNTPRDHGGGLDAAAAAFGGSRADWIDMSTGINPNPYPVPQLTADAWTALPDQAAADRLSAAARRFWRVPDTAGVLAAPGASALIARIPALAPAGHVAIDMPTYNEHAAAFRAHGWQVNAGPSHAARVVVHPNNPDGRWTDPARLDAPLTVIDESFCDIAPQQSLIAHAAKPGVIVLKSFGKFWGLAGLRLGFAIARPETLAPLADWMGPWPVSGPALAVGAAALDDNDWATATRTRLNEDAARLDTILTGRGAVLVGGTPLFRLYSVDDALAWQTRLAKIRVWSRIFPYSARYLRLGLPPDHGWSRLNDTW